MSFALGDVVTLTMLTYDSGGSLANCGAVALTITLPDGTTATPTVTNPPAVTGTYTYDYTPAAEGLYLVRWVFTSTNAQAPPLDSFYVDASDVAPLVSLAEARKQCRLSGTADDTELQRFIRIASTMAEDHTQIWRRQTFTATQNGGTPYIQLEKPIISVTTVTEDGTAITSTGYVIDSDRGRLYRGTTSGATRWNSGIENIVVTYVVGPSDGVIPDPIRQGILVETQHLWDTQRGGQGVPRQIGMDLTIDPRTGFSIPRRVLELWEAYMPGVMVA